MITQEERKRLGEYYTPRWLAKEITETVVDAPLSQRVLDPSCGSGTFIETAVERILNHSGGLSRTETLKKLQENVVGIDIHPVAVQLAKATWVKAVATLMRELHAADRNHVWAYYIRNMIRPAVIAEEKVDRIIGNPPWLTYGQSADIIRQELRQ